LEKYRFFVVFLYILADFSNSILYQTFSPIATQLKVIYNLNSLQVTIVAGLMLFLIPFSSFPANRTIDKLG
jgi:hypothetical protein